MSKFVSRKKVGALPRIPLRGTIDLTYRCNNDCRHCWLRLAPGAPERARELSFEDIRRIADEARALGCRTWTISGGEPMLRPDFAEIFDHLTARSAGYTLLTNGTLITPAIARLMKRRGAKLVALYGASPDVHDDITRTPGSFEALGRGIALLREAGAGFTVQVVPMKGNFHQYRDMIRLAESWSPSWRLGASWLYLSADRDEARNREIRAQRLDPGQVLELEPFAPPGIGDLDGDRPACPDGLGDDLYADCIASRRDFHIDPTGGLSFCAFAKDPVHRCDLRKTSFEEAWTIALPAMAGKVKAGPDYHARCGACRLRGDCRWCPVYAYLEHGDHSAPVEYLCRVAEETRKARDEWAVTRRRTYRIGGITIQLDADLPFTDGTFRPKFELFRASGTGPETISIHHHFSLPDLDGEDLGEEVYRTPPWAIYRKDRAWIYKGIYPGPDDGRVHRVVVFDETHTRARVFHPSPDLFHQGPHDSLMLLSSDQIFLARALPQWGGAFVHAAGVSLRGQGLLFAGPSEAGKSTIVKMLRDRAEILCDDRIIVRKTAGGFDIHGTWSHGEVPLVSASSAPLRAVLFLRQAKENRLIRVQSPEAVLRDLLPRFVRPLLTADWWEDVLDLAGEMIRDVPFYELHFDKSGEVVEALEELAG
jgi:MoaA/NifB/PqqE/SkfB family radical SAM enzyme